MVRSLREVYREIEKLAEKAAPFVGRGLQLGNLAPNAESVMIPQVPQPLNSATIPSAPQRGIARGFAEVVRQPRQEMISVTPIEALAEVINNPEIQVDREMMEVINDPSQMFDLGSMRMMSNQFSRSNLLPKKKRKVSKYQKQFGIQLKKLKKKHPRTKITQLMKRAHRATRKALKMK